MISTVVFENEKLKISFEKLKDSKTEERQLYGWIESAYENLEKDAFCGIQIPKRLIPRFYEKRFGELNNLWKYNLPNAWRLIYTIQSDKVVVLSVILEWLDHKDYERRFKY